MAKMETIHHWTGRTARVPRASVRWWLRQGWTDRPHTRAAANDDVNAVAPIEIDAPDPLIAPGDEPDEVYDVDGSVLPLAEPDEAKAETGPEESKIEAPDRGRQTQE